MYIDKKLQLSAAQEITTSAASTNYIDLGAAGNAYEENWLHAFVDTAFAGSGITLTVAVQTDDNTSFSSPKTLAQTPAIAVTDLTAGAEVIKQRIPQGCERYVRLYYTASSTGFTAGKITANVAKDVRI